MPRAPRAVVSIVALLFAAILLHVSAARASSTQETILEDNAKLLSDPAGTLATLRKLGVGRVRLNLIWYTVAPSASSHHKPHRFDAANPGAYPRAGWARYDAVIRDAAADGIRVLLTLTGGAPLWATGPGAPAGSPFGAWRPSSSEYGLFVRAAGKRYSGSYIPAGAGAPLPRVNFWSVWNESNYGPDLAPQATASGTIEVGPAMYRKLLDSAWSALRATGHGHDTIAIGETAPRGVAVPGNFNGIKPLRWLRALYCVDSSYRPLRGSAASARGCPSRPSAARFRADHPALFKASAFADHPYEQGTPPDIPTYACGSAVCHSHSSRGARSDPDYADLPEVPRLERALDRVQRVYHSSTRFPVYSTEYGYWTKPPDPDATISPSTAAYYINWAEYLSWRQRRLLSYDQYLLVDPARHNFASGLEFPNGRPKVTFDAFRMPIFLPSTTTSRGRRVEVWGCVRPAHFAALDTGLSQQVQIEFRPSGARVFVPLSAVPITNPRGYFDTSVVFPGSGSVRLAWRYPSGAQVYSRTVKVKVR